MVLDAGIRAPSTSRPVRLSSTLHQFVSHSSRLLTGGPSNDQWDPDTSFVVRSLAPEEVRSVIAKVDDQRAIRRSELLQDFDQVADQAVQPAQRVAVLRGVVPQCG